MLLILISIVNIYTYESKFLQQLAHVFFVISSSNTASIISILSLRGGAFTSAKDVVPLFSMSAWLLLGASHDLQSLRIHSFQTERILHLRVFLHLSDNFHPFQQHDTISCSRHGHPFLLLMSHRFFRQWSVPFFVGRPTPLLPTPLLPRSPANHPDYLCHSP